MHRRPAGIATLVAAAVALVMVSTSQPAAACFALVKVTFAEDSPDVFRVAFERGALFELLRVRIDLHTSAGRSFIDTPYGGSRAGGKGEPVLQATEGFVEGARAFTLRFKRFQVGQVYTLMVDLDDDMSHRDRDLDHLTDGELEGARAEAWLRGPDGDGFRVEGRFGRDGVAELGGGACS